MEDARNPAPPNQHRSKPLKSQEPTHYFYTPFFTLSLLSTYINTVYSWMMDVSVYSFVSFINLRCIFPLPTSEVAGCLRPAQPQWRGAAADVWPCGASGLGPARTCVGGGPGRAEEMWRSMVLGGSTVRAWKVLLFLLKKKQL